MTITERVCAGRHACAFVFVGDALGDEGVAAVDCQASRAGFLQ